MSTHPGRESFTRSSTNLDSYQPGTPPKSTSRASGTGSGDEMPLREAVERWVLPGREVPMRVAEPGRKENRVSGTPVRGSEGNAGRGGARPRRGRDETGPP